MVQFKRNPMLKEFLDRQTKTNYSGNKTRMSISDQELFDELGYNNRNAFESIYKKYFHQLVVYISDIVLDKEIAEEIAQETMVKLWEMRSRLNRDAGIRGLIFTIARNISFNYIKSFGVRQKRIGSYQEKALIMQHNLEALNDETAQPVYSDEIKKIVEQTLEQMPGKTKEIFIMSRFRNLSYQEIASFQGLSIKSVEYHISEALKLFRQSLKDYL